MHRILLPHSEDPKRCNPAIMEKAVASPIVEKYIRRWRQKPGLAVILTKVKDPPKLEELISRKKTTSLPDSSASSGVPDYAGILSRRRCCFVS